MGAAARREATLVGRSARGLAVAWLAVAPVLVVIALFSKEILTVWVGPQHADQWPWLALSLFVPVLSLMLGAGAGVAA